MKYEIEFPTVYGDVMEFDNYEDARDWVLVLLNNVMQGGGEQSVKVMLSILHYRHADSSAGIR